MNDYKELQSPMNLLDTVKKNYEQTPGKSLFTGLMKDRHGF